MCWKFQFTILNKVNYSDGESSLGGRLIFLAFSYNISSCIKVLKEWAKRLHKGLKEKYIFTCLCGFLGTAGTGFKLFAIQHWFLWHLGCQPLQWSSVDCCDLSVGGVDTPFTLFGNYLDEIMKNLAEEPHLLRGQASLTAQVWEEALFLLLKVEG